MSAAPTSPRTLGESFSFYVPATQPQLIEECSALADAVTVKGPNGPAVVSDLRRMGWDRPVLFDRAGYDPKIAAIEPDRWFDAQEAAGADRLLTAGTWVEWDPTGDALKVAVEVEACRMALGTNATAVLAVDHRWLTKSPMALVEAINSLDGPVALVLAHPTDPLGPANAVHGLLAVARNTTDLSILRTDHGGLGGIVHGAQHAAIGLIGTYRHFVPVGKFGGGKRNDVTARVFIREMLDWFTALTISGWSTMPMDLRCHLSCCNGDRLDRFFDTRYEHEAPKHNRVTLADLADEILGAPAEERRRYFADLCNAAIKRYGAMGKMSMVTKPKDQLVQWAFV
jgi:hypothetical protein